MQKLKAGIQRYQADGFVNNQKLFETLIGGQNPLALFITCSDSRIDPNRLTDTQPGELFILRTVGNIVPPFGSMVAGEAATIEYAVTALNIRDIIICGHSHCGAMSGLLDPESVEDMPAVKEYLEYAESSLQIVDEKHSHLVDSEIRLKRIIEENVLLQLENLRTHPVVATALAQGDMHLYGWIYEFETGEVLVFHPETNTFLPIEGDLSCGPEASQR
ncbi:MAG TPA: carbonic anhydrase [Planctomycetes bacterium]|nr:carbonic anhydrase [Planctomycetaceae bacterium]HIN54324.1 carbonic anhydrase [Planctomycetota bacterium]